MYKNYLKTLNKNGKTGVFISIDIPANSPIIEFTGDFFTKLELKHDMLEVLQVGENYYMGPSGDLDDYIAHSCNPNCYIKVLGNRAILYSLYVIKAGSEITFDYSTSSTDDPKTGWSMKCNCGDPNCRKIISGFSSLTPELQQEYKDKKIAASFLVEPVLIRKTSF